MYLFSYCKETLKCTPELMYDREYFNYVPRVVNVFKLLVFSPKHLACNLALLFHQFLIFYHLWLPVTTSVEWLLYKIE